jgi:lysophospholipid acyltransferase (LPLAT)-like uncharacterized protein
LIDFVGRHLGPRLAVTLARSWRMVVTGAPAGVALARSGKPYVLACWHEVLLPVMWQHRGTGLVAVISEARDGQHLAGFASRLGYGFARGSSSRGGGKALRGAIRALQAGRPVGFTPDGPRGPVRVAKPGVVTAAAAGRVPLLAVRVRAEPAWRARSWDRFVVPKPGARVCLDYADPLEVGHDPGARADALARLTELLTDGAETLEWQHGAATPTA